MTIAWRIHLFSFRTQKLSFSAPKVLAGWPAGRIGRCHIIFLDSSAAGQPYRFPPKRQQQGQALAEDTKRKFVSLNFPKIFLDSSAAGQPYRFPPKRQQQGQALAEDTKRKFVSLNFPKIFLDSSAAEHPAVNRRVVGSNPTRGAIFVVRKSYKTEKAQDIVVLCFFVVYILCFCCWTKSLNSGAAFCPIFQKTGLELTTSF